MVNGRIRFDFDFDPIAGNLYLKREEERLRLLPLEELDYELAIAKLVVSYPSNYHEVNIQNQKLVDMIESIILERILLENDHINTQEDDQT